MIPTIYNYKEALQTPSTSLSRLRTADVSVDAGGEIIISRTALFVEFRIVWQGARYLLGCPLSPISIQRAEEGQGNLNGITSERILPYRILRDELSFYDSMDGTHTADVVLQALPEGEILPKYLKHGNTEHILEELDELQAILLDLGISHNNLKPENIVVGTDGKLYPIRYSYLRRGSGSDREAFEYMRKIIRKQEDVCCVSSCASTNTPCPVVHRRFPGHIWVGNMFEQLVCVEDITGYGFVDPDNNQVIKSQYLWASDFKEGRAEVETAQGMGLIDRLGRNVIAPKYQIVDYDVHSGLSRVKHNEQWALFDYSGDQVTPFGDHYIKDEELQQSNKIRY